MAPADHEPADHLVALTQLDGPLEGGLGPDDCRTAPTVGCADVDRNPIEAQLALQARGERGQQLVAGLGADVIHHVADDLQRIIAGAERETVDRGGDAAPEGVGEHGDHAGGADEQPGRRAAADRVGRARPRRRCRSR